MVGQTLGHYRILQRLGEGGMGVVYKALDTKLNRQVALKLLPPELTSDPERRLRFQREAQMAAALDHPNIATIYEVGEHEGAPYLAMQLLEGQTLRQRIGERSLPVREWLKLALPIAEALAHAHARRVMHRDLKPDNVMLTTEQQVKILDFGLAKLLDRGPAAGAGAEGQVHSQLETISQELSRAGKVFGTVAYMSPEQARGEPADHRSDLFSFGIMLYQMASGRLPFRGKSGVETLHAIIAEEPTPLSQVATEFPAEGERLVRKAMEKEPERRYQDAADLAADLRNLQRDLDSGKVSTTAGRDSGARAGSVATEHSGRGLRKWRVSAGVAVAGLALLAGVLGYRQLQTGRAGDETAFAERKKIVVLPFKNLGAPEDEYFADGLTEEITSRLAAVRDLGVISRSSAVQYANTEKRTRQIAEELGVEYVLEGTVRWARTPGDGAAGASRVRITPQLIRASDDTHLWADSYDRVMEDIFEVQSDIAVKVIQQLGVALLEPERRAVGSKKPTNNPEAYQAYLRGLHHLHQPGFTEEKFQIVTQMFQRAVDLDPSFALAHAGLSRAHAAFRHHGHDFSRGRLAITERAAKRALELAPDLGEAHLALGYYYYHGLRDYERALVEFAIAEKGMPNNADLLSAIGYVRRRQGQWEEALQNIRKALELNPLDTGLTLEVGITYRCLRQYAEADHSYDRGIALAPDSIVLYEHKADNHLAWTGRTEQARATLEKMPQAGETAQSDLSAAQRWFWLEVYEGRPREALERLMTSPAAAPSSLIAAHPKTLLAGHAHALLGEPELARREYDAARAFLEKRAMETPDDYGALGALGIALAGLGRKDEALRQGRRAVETYPLSKDAFDGAGPISDLALIYTMVGDPDAALDQLERLLSIPGFASIRIYRLNPLFKPLWDHPRFKKLEERYGQGA